MPGGDPLRVIEVVAALIARDDEVLLVQQQGPEDTTPSWSLPGGRVHAGELLHEALIREVAEETGLNVSSVGSLAYAVHVDDPKAGRHVVGFVFEAEVADGPLLPADPDELILDVWWIARDAAAALLRTTPWRSLALSHGDRRHGATGAAPASLADPTTPKMRSSSDARPRVGCFTLRGLRGIALALDVPGWIAAYGRAWREKDADAAAVLFTENAVYRSSPFREPHRGRAGIREYWRAETADQAELTLLFGEPLVSGNRVAVEWWAMMTDRGWAESEGATDARLTLPGCLVLSFDDTGLCEELREYWHVVFGEPLTPPVGWGQ